MTMTLSPEEIQILFPYAMRYTVGRQSYAVGEMCDIIRDKWPEIPPATRSILHRDLKTEVQSDRPLGMKFDRKCWENLLEFMEKNV
jgi:hypothetical protein